MGALQQILHTFIVHLITAESVGDGEEWIALEKSEGEKVENPPSDSQHPPNANHQKRFIQCRDGTYEPRVSTPRLRAGRVAVMRCTVKILHRTVWDSAEIDILYTKVMGGDRPSL